MHHTTRISNNTTYHHGDDPYLLTIHDNIATEHRFTPEQMLKLVATLSAELASKPSKTIAA